VLFIFLDITYKYFNETSIFDLNIILNNTLNFEVRTQYHSLKSEQNYDLILFGYPRIMLQMV